MVQQKKIIEFDYMKLRISVQRSTHDKINRQMIDWEKVFVKSEIDKGLTPRIYSKVL